MSTFGTLLKNELKLNIRNMNMVVFAVAMPLVVLVILGLLYGAKPAADGAAYTFVEQSFGALCAISICAGGLMGLPLVVAEYRERKILKRFQVTPVSPVMLLAVEFTIYVIYAAASMAILFPVVLECHYAGLLAGVPGELAADDGVHPERWHDGGRHSERRKDRERDRLRALFPHAALFRRDIAV